MSNLTNDIRLALDSGKSAIGMREVMRSLNSDEAKLIIIASTAENSIVDDIVHIAKIINTRVIVYESDSMELGTVCGKPYSVSSLSIIDPGNSKILEKKY